MKFIIDNQMVSSSIHESDMESMGGFHSKIENLYFAFLAISMVTIESGLGPRVLMHMVLPLVILLHYLDAPNWFVALLIVLVAFWI